MSGSKPKFTSMALDKLIDESLAEADELETEMKDIDSSQLSVEPSSNDEDLDKNWADSDNLIDKKTGSSVSFNYVYKKISDLIDNGNAALQLLQSIDIEVTDANMLNATATLMNSIRGCISEFTKIHQQWIRFNQNLEMENRRFEHKKELIKYRNDLKNNQQEAAQAATDLYELKSSDLVAFLQWQKEQRQKEKEKEDKI